MAVIFFQQHHKHIIVPDSHVQARLPPGGSMASNSLLQPSVELGPRPKQSTSLLIKNSTIMAKVYVDTNAIVLDGPIRGCNDPKRSRNEGCDQCLGGHRIHWPRLPRQV